MAENYITHNVYLESADMYVLIVQFPDTAVDDKLAPLSSERGLIYKSFYEQFVVGICLADATPFFHHVKRRPELTTRFSEIWREVIGKIYHYSPGFRPGNVMINQNNVLKTRGGVEEGEEVRPLEENSLWNKPAPGSWLDGKPADKSNKDKNPFQDADDESDDEMPFDDTPTTGRGGDEDTFDHIPHTLVGHRWATVAVYINVRQFQESHENLVNLIGPTSFKSDESYYLLVIQRCLVDWSDIITLLEQTKVTAKLTPPQIFKELYEIIISYNPFLRLDNIDAPALRRAYREMSKAPKAASRIKNVKKVTAGASKKTTTKKEQTRTFGDVKKSDLLKLGESLRKHVVGQDEAIDAVVEAVQRASVGLKREHEPLGVFMFTGNTGMGKTETAKALSECLEANLVRIDCQDFQHGHEVAKLAGSPPGYVGHDDGGQLTNAVSKYPFSVVLFDEIEKAHSAFHERLLQIIDDGVLTDNKGNTVSFKDTIIIMTSNIGVGEVDSINKTVGFGAVAEKTDKKVTGARTDALKKKFKPEFLNRIDEIVHFRVLEKNDYLHILDILLEEVGEQVYSSKSITLSFAAEAKTLLLDKGIDKKFGARPLRRAVKKYVNTPMARAILADEISPNTKVLVGAKDDKLTFKPAKSVMTEDGQVEEVEL